MSNVVPMLGRRAPAPSPLIAFGLARRDMLRAYAEWLRSNPPAPLVREEVEGTLSALVSLAQTGGENA